jgi:hypothetical protein
MLLTTHAAAGIRTYDSAKRLSLEGVLVDVADLVDGQPYHFEAGSGNGVVADHLETGVHQIHVDGLTGRKI